MEEINLDKYKSAWKAEQSFDEEKLSREQITSYMHSASRHISGLFRKSLVTDIIIKSMLTFSLCGLILLYADQSRALAVIAMLIMMALICIVLQVRTWRMIPGAKSTGQDTRSLLHTYVSFYSRGFVPSLIIAALSGPLIFVSGSLYYFCLKYGTIRPLQLEDFLVLGSMVIISFLLSAFVQVKNFSFHIGQLKESLAEIEQDTLTGSRLNQYRKIKNRNLVIYSIILVAGLLLLVIFLLQNR